jgi:DNA replication and repair protein RecF
LPITSLNLSHFRSHRAARLAFDGRPVAIVGPNGAGKTNILEAVSLLSPGRGLRRAASEDLARRPEALGWKVSANVQGLSAAHEVETWAEPGEARQVRIDGKAATQASWAGCCACCGWCRRWTGCGSRLPRAGGGFWTG